LATGDAVNGAARLEQAARPGEVLIGEATFRLIQELVDAEPVEPLSLKGKSEPVPAFRLRAVTGEPSRRHRGPMVGRERQLRQLADAFANVVDDAACHLFTILGAAGVGKSRLAAESLDGLDATVVRGRCLSYGEGITLWPVVEVLQVLDMRPEDEQAAREALELADATDLLHSQAGAHKTLAAVLAAAGDADAAAASYERAAEAFGRKGDVVSERRVRERLSAPAP
jgi:hypothetical protein